MNGAAVVTGMGCVSPAGIGVDALWDRCCAGTTCIQNTPDAWDRFLTRKSKVWSALPEIDWSDLGFRRKDTLHTDPVGLLAIAAATEALTSAGYDIETPTEKGRARNVPALNPGRVGVFIGTGVGGVRSWAESTMTYLFSSYRDRVAEVSELDAWKARVSPFSVPRIMANGACASVSMWFGFRGPSVNISLACASGTSAIGHALYALQRGDIDVAVAGGSDYLDDGTGALMYGFDCAGTLTRELPRPFDAHRDGFLYAGGGAGMLVLERTEHWQARERNALGLVSGFAEGSDGSDVMAPPVGDESLSDAIGRALAMADRSGDSVDYVNTHGTGTLRNDEHEAAAIQRLFPHGPSINSTKSIIGHTLGASGALEAVVTLKSLGENKVHGTANVSDPLPGISLVQTTEKRQVDVALSVSSAFGGHNSILVMEKARQ